MKVQPRLPIRVHLFRDLPQEGWPSMEVYADGLLAGFAANQDPDLEVVPIAGPALGASWRGPARAAATLFARAVLYPWRAGRQRGQINHVLDHSYGHLVRRLDPRRTVVTVHDLAPLAEPRGRWGVSRRMWEWALAGALGAGRIVADSHFTRQELLRLTPCEPSRVAVAPLGVGLPFRPIHDAAALAAVRARYRLPAGPFLLHVGHTAPRKNLPTLLLALARLADRGSPACLVQAGGVFDSGHVESIRRLGLEGRVVALGTVPRADLPALYNLAHGFVFPSLYEGFGLPVLEAMVCGTPVICSDAASLPEVAGDAAALLPPGDVDGWAEAMAALLEDADQCQSLRAAGLRRAAGFTWVRAAAAVAQVYRELWQEAGPGPAAR